MLKAAAFVVFVLLVTGCAGFGPDFGTNQIKVSRPLTEGLSNIATIRDINTIPNSPVLPGDQMDLSFIIENTDNQESLKNVNVELYDAASFLNGQGMGGTGLCNLVNVMCTPEAEACTIEKCDMGSLAPGGQKLINYKLIAPSADDILKLSTDFELRFAVQHDYIAKTTYRPVAVNADEIKALQRAGQQVSIEAPTSIGSGPLKLDVSLKNRDFILNNNKATFEVRARHTGTGRLADNKIAAGKLVVTFVGIGCDKFTDKDAVVGLKFTSASLQTTGGAASCKFMNKEDIVFFSQGLSVPMLFTMSGDDIGNVPQKSYEVTATADYTYRLSGVAAVTVKPAEI
ncbi:MAG TPA: hypothetical protein VI979_03235 [archaeon]|nr:hypothetical protein [archaeon]